MRDGSLRYGLSGGVGAAVAGVLALIVGGIVAPVTSRTTSADQVVVAVFIRAIFAYVGLGAALGLAYYAGMQAEKRRIATLAQESLDVAAQQLSRDPFQWGVTGAVVMVFYWVVTTVYAYLYPATPTPVGVKNNAVQMAVQHAVYGLVLVLLGAGFGVFGGRMAFTRRVMSRIVVSQYKATLPEQQPSANGATAAQPAPEPAEIPNPPSATAE